jgi:alkylmercury lyase
VVDKRIPLRSSGHRAGSYGSPCWNEAGSQRGHSFPEPHRSVGLANHSANLEAYRAGLGMTAKILEPPSDVEALIRIAAFRLLLAHAVAITDEELAAATGIRREKLDEHLSDLHLAGRIRRDEAGRVIGCAGLSVTKDRHEIELDGRQFWTWCAYDILGIFGALGANGRALSPSPDGQTIVVQFEKGRPVNSNAVLFRPDDELMSCCENVYEEWCPNSNLFADAERAKAWAVRQGLNGRVMDLSEASALGADDWAEVV